MTKKSQIANVLPGASSLGYGFNIATALSPTSITTQIVNLDELNGTTITKFGVDYLLPLNVSEIDRNVSSLNYNSFTSESQYCDHMSAQASASASGWGFSAEFAASYESLSQGDSTNFYGLVEANSILWDTQLKSITGNALNPDFVTALSKLPTTFDTNTQFSYFAFFDQWGTHILHQCRVGGNLSYLVTSENSSNLTQQSAAVSMQLEYSSLFFDASASAEADWNKMASSWISNRKAQATAVGGSPGILDGMVGPTNPVWQPDNSCANVVAAWTSTLPANPGIVSTSLTPIPNVLTGLGSTSTEMSKYQNSSNQLSVAMAVYLNAPILVSNTSSFMVNAVQALPFLTRTTTTIIIDQTAVPPARPPRMTDLSMYWVVMADKNGNVTFNQNFNTEDPDDLDTIIQTAKEVSDGQQWWVCVCIVNQTEAPISTTAANWFEQIGIDTVGLTPGTFYPGMSCVVTMIGKTNCSFQRGEINHYMPCESYWSYDGQVQDINTAAAVPLYVNINE